MLKMSLFRYDQKMVKAFLLMLMILIKGQEQMSLWFRSDRQRSLASLVFEYCKIVRYHARFVDRRR
jgi:hypothetical protein